MENIVTVKAFGKCLKILIGEVYLSNISALQQDCFLLYISIYKIIQIVRAL